MVNPWEQGGVVEKLEDVHRQINPDLYPHDLAWLATNGSWENESAHDMVVTSGGATPPKDHRHSIPPKRKVVYGLAHA